MNDIAFYKDSGHGTEEVGRLRADGTWDGDVGLGEDVAYVLLKHGLDKDKWEERKELIKIYSGAYLWAVEEVVADTAP